MTTLWVDAGQGAAGDMLLAALVDAGAGLDSVRSAVRSVVPVQLDITAEVRDGFLVTRAHTMADQADADAHRTWGDVRALLDAADLDPRVAAHAHRAFRLLVDAEGALHGVPAEAVVLHEVGAHDAIADVVGVAAAVVDLGVTDVVVSPLTLGTGSTTTRHGVVPVPVPAVLEIAARTGLAVSGVELPGEACTPTGAALLGALATAQGTLPAGTVTATGVGAGSRPTPGRFGALRVALVMGVPGPGARRHDATVLETNVDDLDPRLWPHVLSRLLDAGASDAWLTPILMKKGRPAHTLSVLAPAAVMDGVRRLVATETSAIGWREHDVTKHALQREVVQVIVDGHRIDVKLALLGGEVVNAQPEWDHVMAAATVLRRPVKSVLATAIAKAHQGTEE